MKIRPRSQDVILFLLILLLLISGYGHLQNIDKEQAFNNGLLKTYVYEIQRAASSAETAVDEGESAYEEWMTISLSALEVAEQTAASLSSHSEKYSLNNGAEVYGAAPFELRALIKRGQDLGLQKAELEKISAVLAVYAGSLNFEAIKEPENFREVYIDIHETVQEEGILENEEELILEKFVR